LNHSLIYHLFKSFNYSKDEVINQSGIY